jgi:hypothetical protein
VRKMGGVGALSLAVGLTLAGIKIESQYGAAG